MEDKNSNVSLVVSNCSKKYGTSKVYSTKNINLDIHGGDIFGFIGPNGAGKSTCIKSIIGLLPPTEGTISVCGRDIVKNPKEAKALIGYVPDHYALYENLTGKQFIDYIVDIYGVDKNLAKERIEKYLTLFELKDAYDKKINTYSHGMKQKITIISALVHNPKLWILDEPLTGLDPTSIYQVKQCMIEHAKAGNIVFFSSHIIEVVEKLCTRIAIIKKGEIIYDDSMANTTKNHKKGLEDFYMELIGENVNE